MTESEVDVRANREISMISKLAGEFFVNLVPSWCMVNLHNARKRSPSKRTSEVRIDDVTIISVDRNCLR